MDERVLCPECGEEIPAIARKCKHCDAYLEPELRGKERLEAASGGLAAFGLGVVLLCVVCVLGGTVATVAVPTYLDQARRRNEEGAVAALEAIRSAQERLAAAPRPDGEGFGDLGALGRADLIDDELQTGIRGGYKFEVAVSPATPTEAWIAVATPIAPGKTGDKYFVTNHTGEIYYRVSQPIPLDSRTCAPPPDAMPLGAREGSGPPR